MIELRAKDLAAVKIVLAEHLPGLEVRAFGSRVSGGAARFSDLDLAVMSTRPLDYGILGRTRDAFSESDLPFRVDVLDWSALSDDFRKIVSANYEVVQVGVEGRSAFY